MTRYAAVLVAVLLEPAFLRAQVDCSRAGRTFPAVPVPECVDPQGVAVSCAPGRIRLWPSGIQPASPIPLNRDSTDRLAGKTIPGRASGHEIFSSLDVVTVGGVSRRLYVAYNAGLQVWNIDPQVSPAFPANPRSLDSRDGWSGEFLKWPPVSEVLNFIEDVSAVNVSSTLDVVAVAGFQKPVGLTLWEFNTSTRNFRQLYQDEGIHARQVRLIKRNAGALYAIVGADEGLAVYDVTAARALSSPCLDNQGSVCATVFRGYVTRQARQYIDALHVPGNDRVFVSASNGTSFRAPPIELWELADPQNPSAATRRMSELRNAAGSALFRYDGHHYLAMVSEEDGVDREKLRVLLVDGCVGGSNCSFAGGTVKDAVSPISLDPAAGDGADYGTTRDLLTYSELNGKPYLYYGVATGGLQGPDFDRLFDLRDLRPPDPSPLPGLPEVTAGGGSYRDPCNGAKIRYWSHYYSRNVHGLNDMVPRVGKLSTGGYFYRAAATILDVHVLGAATLPPGGAIAIVAADTGQRNAFESCESVPLAAKLAGRGPAWWEWRFSGQALAGCSGNLAGSGDLADAVLDCQVPAARFLRGPIFSDGFESGNTRAWSVVVSPRLAGAAAAGVTAEVLVWKTADKSLPPEDVEQVAFTIVESATPQFSGAPQTAVSGLAATLTHPAVNATTWSWEIESPAGAATCTFPGRGQVRCFKTTTTGPPTPEALTHTWPAPGTYKYRVTVSNCGAATAVRDAEVTVAEVLVTPDVLSFTLRGAQAACCGNVLSGFTCSRGVEVEFTVRMKVDASYAFSFDWARTSPTASPNFTFQAPAGRDAARLEWYFKRTFASTGSFLPIVRARLGGAGDDQVFVTVPLQVVNGSCR